ncbi:MAG TPA: cytidine deaminase [Thermoanaerobaculia bacterium]|nr:cytidine deaminase [Thermoanaerobaculia bacterium]
MDWTPLIEAAWRARDRSYSPFSGFAVGAALLARDGSIHVGCNVENRSYGLTVCAERTAVCSAVAAGCRDFVALVVAADAEPPARPCGMCLDTLAEFDPDLPILLVNRQGEQVELRGRELLTQPFRFPERGDRR